MTNNLSEQCCKLKTYKTENYISIYISILTPFLIITLYSNFLGNDNTATIYQDLTNSPAYWLGQYQNYRYTSAIIGYIIHYSGYSYFDFLPLWILLFSVSISFAALETVKFLEFPIITTPFALLFISTSPYFTDLYLFAMVFSNYGISLFAIALSLYCCRKFSPPLSIITTAIFAIIILSSYQPFILVLPFLGALKIMKISLKREKDIFSAIVPVAGFLIGTLLYLVIIKLIGPEQGRNVSSGNTLKNISDYIKQSFDILLYGKQPFESSYQAWFYLISLTIIFIIFF